MPQLKVKQNKKEFVLEYTPAAGVVHLNLIGYGDPIALPKNPDILNAFAKGIKEVADLMADTLAREQAVVDHQKKTKKQVIREIAKSKEAALEAAKAEATAAPKVKEEPKVAPSKK